MTTKKDLQTTINQLSQSRTEASALKSQLQEVSEQISWYVPKELAEKELELKESLTPHLESIKANESKIRELVPQIYSANDVVKAKTQTPEGLTIQIDFDIDEQKAIEYAIKTNQPSLLKVDTRAVAALAKAMNKQGLNLPDGVTPIVKTSIPREFKPVAGLEEFFTPEQPEETLANDEDLPF